MMAAESCRRASDLSSLIENRKLALADVASDGSRFAVLRRTPSPPQAQALRRSLGQLGQLAPIVAFVSDRAARCEVVDGFARIAAAHELGWSYVSAQVVGTAASIATVLDLIIQARPELPTSAVTAARLIALARDLGASTEVCCDLLASIGLPSHPRLLANYQAVAQLPEPVLDFCSEKGFSFKQCARLASYSRELVELVFSFRDRASLTASLLPEILEDLADYLRARKLEVATLAQDPKLESLLAGRCPPQVAARRLRDFARSLRSPLLTGVNLRMDRLRDSLKLPANIGLAWDRSLENHKLHWNFTAESVDEWRATVAFLGDPGLSHAVASLLDDL